MKRRKFAQRFLTALGVAPVLKFVPGVSESVPEEHHFVPEEGVLGTYDFIEPHIEPRHMSDPFIFIDHVVGGENAGDRMKMICKGPLVPITPRVKDTLIFPSGAKAVIMEKMGSVLTIMPTRYSKKCSPAVLYSLSAHISAISARPSSSCLAQGVLLTFVNRLHTS